MIMQGDIATIVGPPLPSAITERKYTEMQSQGDTTR